MQSQLIREKFSSFFNQQGHLKIKSSPLIPQGDQTLLFANAGMNQFKDYFTGKAQASHLRAVTIQKCVRAGGKHNDLENVGFTARHHTFFEMLGNFSFGDYFKRDAIRFAWDFLTKELQIPRDKLRVTVHDSDDEAFQLWEKDIGIPKEWIYRLGDKSNFWEMGDVGPCGPCSEIFFDHGPSFSTGTPPGQQEIDDEGRFVEIWNLVFMQFEKYKEGHEIKRKPLPKPSVDTGAGLERIAAALQGKYFNYDSDVFSPIMQAIGTLCRKNYESGLSQSEKSSFRVVADHIRAATMLITDGVIPSNEGRGYVLRRIIRRAIRHLSQLGVKDIAFYKLANSVFESLGKEYPDNEANLSLAEKLLQIEEEKFRKTLETGLQLIHQEIALLAKGSLFSGATAFKLYDTFGFPLDLTEVILREKNIGLDHASFESAMKEQKEKSKKSAKFQASEGLEKTFYEIKEKSGETQFKGYELHELSAKLIKKVDQGEMTYLIFHQTPFYPEGGGQVGDTGHICSAEGTLATVIDTHKPVEGLIVHISKDADALIEGQTYQLKIDSDRRELIKKNHSATHLLQAALIKVLGNHVKQAGSSVGPDRLRFDFTHTEALSPQQLLEVEKRVNLAIQAAEKVQAEIMSKDQAQTKGAMALFGEKYGEKVRVLTMGDVSCELCGGTHVQNTQEIQLFKILFETSLASGVRRIEALTASSALQYLNERSGLLAELEKTFSVKEEKVLEKVSALQTSYKELTKQLEQLEDRLLSAGLEQRVQSPRPLKSSAQHFYCQVQCDDLQLDQMKKLADMFIQKNPASLGLFVSKQAQSTTILLKRASSQMSHINCGELLKKNLSHMNGKGGGKPDSAQGSGETAKLVDFLNSLNEQI